MQLAKAAGVTLSQSERSILTRLTDFIEYAGRYPISKRVEKMRPVKTVARGYITSAELEMAETLTNKLMQKNYLTLLTRGKGGVRAGSPHP